MYLGIRLLENWSHENAERLKSKDFRYKIVKEHFSDWQPEWTRSVAGADGEWMAWPLYYMPTESLNWKSVPGVTLIGDAAHVSTPFVGEGVNCSIYDSLQLAESIKTFGIDRLDEAVAEYEKKMLPRGVDLITRSNANGELMFSDGVVEFFDKMLVNAKEDASAWD